MLLGAREKFPDEEREGRKWREGGENNLGYQEIHNPKLTRRKLVRTPLVTKGRGAHLAIPRPAL